MRKSRTKAKVPSDAAGRTETKIRLKPFNGLQSAGMRRSAPLQALFDDAPDVHIVTDCRGVIHDVNRAAARLLGCSSAAELRQRNLSEFLPEAAARELLNPDSLQGRRWEGQICPEGGKPVWVAVTSCVSRDQSGRPSWLGWHFCEISEWKQTENALRQSEGLLRLFIDHAPAALAMFDREMRCIDVNPKWLSVLRVRKDEVLGRNHYDVFPQIPERWRRAHAQGLAGKVIRSEGEDSFTLADGTVIWVEWEVRPWYDAAGEVAGIVIYSNDITQRKKAETALRQSESRLTLALEAAEAGTWEWDPRTNETTWSCEMFNLLGLDPNRTSASYSAWLSTVDPVDRPRVNQAVMDAIRLKGDLDTEWRVDKSERWLMSVGRPFFDDSGEAVRYYGIVLDITERKRTELQLRQSRADLELRVEERTRELSETIRMLNERSEQLRQMTAELTLVEQRERRRLAQILHDGLQQILVGAKYRLASAAHLHDGSPDLSPVSALLDDAIATSRSLSAELSPPILVNGDLVAALKWLARWVESKHRLKVDLHSPEHLDPISDEVILLLFQAARELLFNVVKHAGTDSARIEVLQENADIIVQISDEGAGFEPGRLRGEGGQVGGTGLFAISERLTYLGGSLEIDSAPGRGSRFRLTVPLSKPRSISCPEVEEQVPVSAAASQQAEPSPADAKRRIRVMLADDHLVVRQGLAGLIRGEADFEIAGEAADGESAVKLAREKWPDVILMDISMPGMDGIQAARIIHKEQPEIRIIGLSMFQDEELKTAMCEAGAVKYLTKSAPSEGLIEAIRSCVRETRESREHSSL